MSELVLYNRHLEQLRASVACLDTVDEAKDLADKAAAAQTWARRVRLGQEAINHAAEVKLRAERRAGELLSQTVRPGNPQLSRETTIRLDSVGVTRDQSSQWQALASMPDAEFDDALDAVKADGEIVSRAAVMRRMDVHYSSATDLWSTPQDLFDELNGEFGFEVDVCATAENAKCALFFDRETDGLAQEWSGICWMNPPYGDEIAKWVRKAWESAQAGATVVCLVPARIDTGWWWEFCRYGEIRLLRGRLRFGGATTGAPFPSAVVIFGREPNALDVHWERAA